MNGRVCLPAELTFRVRIPGFSQNRDLQVVKQKSREDQAVVIAGQLPDGEENCKTCCRGGGSQKCFEHTEKSLIFRSTDVVWGLKNVQEWLLLA
ncbi:hypothetical protein ACFX2B_023351 [Malus domestica]